MFITGVAFLFLCVLSCILPGKERLYVDEYAHHAQIVSFFKGNFTTESRLTTLPGYHAIFAFIGFIFRNVDVLFFRFIAIIIASLTIGRFSKLNAQINGRIQINKVILFFFLPIVFPLYFLIYTDILSMLLFIMALNAGLKTKYHLAAVFGILNLFVRQNTFFWYVFSFLLFFISNYPVISVLSFRNYLKKSWVFLIGILLFVLFIIINKGVALGDKEMHPINTIHLGNIFFFLFLMGVFILPVTFKNVRRLDVTGLHYLIVISLFVIYYFNFNITHPYNQGDFGPFLRNGILMIAMSNNIFRVLFFIPIAGGILLLIKFYQINKKVCSLYLLFGTLSLIPSWLIEQRYYFLHFLLFFLYGFNESENNNCTISILVYIGICSILLFGMFSNVFFL